MSTSDRPVEPRPNSDSPIPHEAQRVFDTVTGPNVRVKDNLIQLAVVTGGLVLGALLGAVINRSAGNDPLLGALVGGFTGVVVSLLLSGAIIGLIRFVLALRR